MKKTVFSIDGNGAFVGIHNPDAHWNGWAIPYFELDEAIRVCEALKGSDAEYWDFRRDDDADTITLIDKQYADQADGGEDEIHPCVFDGFDGKWYGVGGQCLVWVAEDDKTFFEKDLSGRGYHGNVTLIDLVEDTDLRDEFEEADEDDKEDTVIGWAMNAEVGDEYNEDSATQYTRTA